jgi:hypothetical protein
MDETRDNDETEPEVMLPGGIRVTQATSIGRPISAGRGSLKTE